MSEELIDKIGGMLNEEKWTRAALNNYTINNFKELDEILEEVLSSGISSEVKEMNDEHLDHSKNSIIALYLSGIITFNNQMIDDSYIITLINIFIDNHKWNIVEFLCLKVLEYGEHKFALKVLSDCYSNENREEEKIEIWERLVKIDYLEADIVKKIAEYKEEAGDTEGAVIYYKKAIHRFVSKKMFSSVREIWQKLIEYNSEDYEFFFLLEKKISHILSTEKSIFLLEDLYPVCFDSGNWDVSIELLKRILQYDSKNNWARAEIVKCYKKKYENHSQLDECIRVSNLNQGWRNAFEAISDFEKHISFDAGNFVYHNSWGVGRIKSIRDDVIIIDFVQKRNHEMSLKMAINALLSLNKSHIWVLKSVMSKDKLKAKVKSDIPWTLKVVIKSFENVSDMKRIKAELVPAILTPGEWTSWNQEARKVLKTNPIFGNLPDKADQFVVRDKPMSFEEKTFNKFKAQSGFFDKLQTAQEFLANSDPDSDYFVEMFHFFTSFLKAANVNVQVVCSFLYTQKIIKTYPFLKTDISWGFKDLFDDIDNYESLFLEISDPDLKKDFLIAIKKNLEDWKEIYLQLLPIHLSRQIVDDLIAAGYSNQVKEKLLGMIDKFREYREAFIWIARNSVEDPRFSKLGISYEKILINLVHLLDLTYRDITNKREVQLNRKVNRAVINFLFKEEKLENYLLQSDEQAVIRLFSLLQDVKELDPSYQLDLRQKIESHFEGIVLPGKEIQKTFSVAASAPSRNFYTTEKSYNEKQKELKHILEVEIPLNSKEIGFAIELGDLKENAEYKAGKEKQENLNIQVGKIKDELERARLFNEEMLDTDRISFGCLVTLYNKRTRKNEKFTIMGPWESNPEENIISYLSPFGAEISGKAVDSELEFEINERKFKYKVKKIAAAKVDWK